MAKFVKLEEQTATLLTNFKADLMKKTPNNRITDDFTIYQALMIALKK